MVCSLPSPAVLAALEDSAVAVMYELAVDIAGATEIVALVTSRPHRLQLARQ